jgi:hypothetical protein
MKDSLEMDSASMTHIPGFMKTGLGIEELMGGMHRYTDTQLCYLQFSYEVSGPFVE